MSDKPVILLVEDDEFAADLAQEALNEDYTVQHAVSGEEALAAIQSSAPHLVLLDVSMPGISGYDVCREIRNDLEHGELPVIFLSGMVGADERLAGYEAGGDDYLVKPMVPGELRNKVARVLKIRDEQAQLKTQLSGAFATAFTAMSSAAEVGAVLQFLRASFGCADYEAVAREALAVTQGYGLDCSVQLRGQQGTISRNAEGPCSPLEESVLTNIASQGRIIDFGARTSYSYPGATIIVRNMPKEDPDRYGRMKDNLALLAEGADERITSLDGEYRLSQQQAALKRLIDGTRETLREIDKQRHTQRLATSQIFSDFRTTLERSMLTMGLTEMQERDLAELAQSAIDQTLSLYNAENKSEAHMAELLKQLDQA